MTSYDAKDHGATAQGNGQTKKAWVAPSLQMISLKSAEHGPNNGNPDGPGAHFTRTKS